MSGIKRLFKICVRLCNLPNCYIIVLAKRRGGNFPSRPLSLIFTIPSHCLNTAGVNNLSVRTIGKWSCEDTVLKGSVHLAPLGDFGKSANGSNPRIVGRNAPKTFPRSLVALVLATLRFKKMSWGTAQGREKFPAIEFPESELMKKKGFRSVNRLTGFVKPGGASFEQNLRRSPEFNLQSELTNGLVKALTKKDCLTWRDSRTS